MILVLWSIHITHAYNKVSTTSAVGIRSTKFELQQCTGSVVELLPVVFKALPG